MKRTIGEASMSFTPEKNEILFEGSLRLANLVEYGDVMDYLKEMSLNLKGSLILNFSKLTFLNSSGITIFSMFILEAKQNNHPKIKVIGSKQIAWQEKSFPNFIKLWNIVEIIME